MSQDFRNSSLDAGARATLLLQEMTLDEKCGQLSSVMAWSIVAADGQDSASLEALLPTPPGHVAQLIVDEPKRLYELVGAIQQRFVQRTRLGIPALLHAECVNGFMAGGYMSFPTPIGLASAWSPELVGEMADLIRQQMRSAGMAHALSPVLDVALDPRWGRVHETYGEDPYLCAANGVAFVRGLQGDDLRAGVMATGKHFLGYASTRAGVNAAAVDSAPRRLREIFAYPFEAAIHLAGLRSMMNSYGEIDGMPAGASREVLTDLLRGTLGFDGFVASDYGTVEQLVSKHEVAPDYASAAALALHAGLDVELPTTLAYGPGLADEVRAGRVSLADVDLAVWRVLRAKFEVGLFENPYPAEHVDVQAAALEGAELSRELAHRSVVLLQNDGILPLQRDALTIAVIGPHADAPAYQFATYTYAAWRQAVDAARRGEQVGIVGAEDLQSAWQDALDTPVAPDQLVRDRFGAVGIAEAVAQHANVLSAAGSGLVDALTEDELDMAVHAAETADVVIMALGGRSLWFNGIRTEGEASDSADIALPAAQAQLLERVAALGKPLVLVMMQGRAYALPESALAASAIVVGTYAGPYTSEASADVLFGVVNPSGKLPYTIPRHSGQVPVYHHQTVGSGHRAGTPFGGSRLYLDMEGTPQFHFGQGLSYTQFELSELAHDASAATDGVMHFGATLRNCGTAVGATVVQVYARLHALGFNRPAQQLVGFARVELSAGAAARVEFQVPASILAFVNAQREMAVEPAKVEFFIGLDSDDHALSGEVQLTGETLVLASSERDYLSTVNVISI